MHRALALARELELPPVATSRALLLEPEDFEVHRLLRAIALNTGSPAWRPEETACDSDLLLSPEQMPSISPIVPRRWRIAADRRGPAAATGTFPRPSFRPLRGLGETQAFVSSKSGPGREPAGATAPSTSRVEARLDKELRIIRDKGFAHYFLVVEEIASQSPRTCGRGSAAASLVAYCLGITHVDPIAHNLFFERFLHEGRVDPPDIDIDFPWDERDAILDFAFARYGASARRWSPTRSASRGAPRFVRWPRSSV